MTITLCVLLWAHPGHESELVDYETRVLALVPDHDGRVLNRARTDGSGDRPLEVQLIEFSSQAAMDGYLVDDRRIVLANLRERSVAKTETMRVVSLA